MNQPRVFLFFGRSGSGKGTQAKLLATHLEKEFPSQQTLYVETGALIRKFMERHESNYASKLTKEVIDTGGLLPAFIPIWLWATYLTEHFSGKENLILDGLSRRLNEAPVLAGAFEFLGIEKPIVVYLNVSVDWATRRLLERGRKDDQEKEIRRRLQWFDESVMPVVEYFKAHEKVRFIEINGEQSIEDVEKEIVQASLV